MPVQIAVAQNAVSLNDVTGTVGGIGLPIGGTVEFRLRVQVDASVNGAIAGFTNAFQIYSPDGATWGTIVHDTLPAWAGGTDFDGAENLNSYSLDGMGADTVTYFGFAISGIGAPAGYNEVSWTISVDIPNDPALAGKTLCLDSVQFVDPSNYWLWSDGSSIVPSWDGPHCFQIVDPNAQNKITLEEVTGSVGGTLPIGNTVDFRLRVQVDPSVSSEINSFANAFRIYSTDGATWGSIDHDTLPLWAAGTDFDGGEFFNSYSLDGMGADTVTYSGFSLFGAGAPAGYNAVSWIISVNIPDDPTLVGKTLCMDTVQFIGPSSFWSWYDASGVVVPSWDGPHCYPISGCILQAVDSVHYAGEDSWDFYGASVAGGIDFDHDNIPDYLVGAPGFDGGAGPNTGRVYLYSGATGSLIRHFTGADGDFHGRAVAMAPDLSGSGYAQIIVGTPNYMDGSGIRRGRTYVYDFNGSAWSWHFTVTGAAEGDRFGQSVSVGDFNGDGMADVASGAPYSNVTEYRAGAVYVNSGTNGSNLAVIASPWAVSMAEAGTDVDASGDWDADGKDDILIGVPGRYSGGAGTGGWLITHHKLDASIETLSFTGDGAAGTSVAWIGDVSGGPGDEYVIGMPDYDVPGKGIAGRVEVHGNSLVHVIDGTDPAEDFGATVAGVGDVDGDGVPDFAVGAPGRGAKGRIYVYSGSTFNLIYARVESGYTFYGAAIASTGDVGGACPPDLIVGAYGAGSIGTATVLKLDAGCTSDPICNTCSITATGDVTVDGVITSADIIYTVGYVFKSGPAPHPCAAAGDVNCNGAITSADIIYLVGYVFKGGPAPCDACSLVPGTWSCQ